MPRVSIVLPCYNSEKTIRRALQSIADQTWRDFETIVVDNNCNDRTMEIAQDYITTANVHVVKCETQGIVSALNTGIYNSDSAYIARQDDDDYWHPTKLQKQIDYLEDNPEVDILGTQIRLLDEAGVPQELGTYNRPVRYPLDDNGVRYLLVLGQNPLCHPSIVMKRDVPLRAGGYSEHFHLAEDFHLWLKAFPWFRFANLDEVLVDYTQTLRSDYNPQVVKTIADFYYNLYKMFGIIEGDRPELVYEWEVGKGPQR